VAGTGLIALIDDVASLLDDVSVLTKAAAQKTAGVLGDDLALNAQQVAGVRAERELPVVWAVARGSTVNKAILVPAALAISALAPWAVTPLLMAGGTFLCYEGFEKLAHRFRRGHGDDAAAERKLVEAFESASVDLVAFERGKIRGAVRTDFILSAEIIVIALGTVAAAPFATQVAVLAGVAVLMTVGVYGIVAGIVKLDDAGAWLARRPGTGHAGRAQRAAGLAIVAAAPKLMKGLSVAGTAAMFLVGGGILAHGIPAIGRAIEALAAHALAVPGIGAALRLAAALAGDAIVGVAAGALAVAAMTLARRARRSRAGAA
jgi:predicted DNA repair protein MutK